MKFSTTGVAATGSSEIAVDGVVPTNLVGVTAGNPKWLDAGTLLFNYDTGGAVFGLGTLDPPSGAIVNIDSIGANALGAGNNVWAAYLAGSGVRTSVSGFGPFPLAALGDVDEAGRAVLITSQSTGTGLQCFTSAGVQTFASATALANANVRARSNIVAYEDETGWHLRNMSTGAMVSLAQRAASVGLMIPVVIGSTVYVVEYATDVGISVRNATQGQGYVIPDTVEEMFNADAVFVSGTTIRIGGCVGAGEAPTELRTFDVNVASGSFRSGVTASGALAWTNQTPLTVNALPSGPASGGGGNLIFNAGLYKQEFIDQNKLITRPWLRAFEALNKSVGGPVDLSNTTGVLDQENGGTGTTAGITDVLPSYLRFSDESLLLGRGEGNGAGDGQEISLGGGLTMTGTVLSASGAGLGTVTNTGTLTANALIVGNGGTDVKALASLGTTTTLLHGNAAGLPTFGAVALATDVSGDLPFANLAQGTALSVLGVTGNATADNASIVAASDHQVLRRSGTAVAFGAVNLAQSAAVTGVLPVANGGTGSASGAAVLKTTVNLTNAQVLALPTTPVTVLAAPGSGFAINFMQAFVFANFSAGAYTGASAALSYMMLLDDDGNPWSSFIGNDTSPTPDLTYLSIFLDATDKSFPLLPWQDTSEATAAWGTLAIPMSGVSRDNKSVLIRAINGGTDFGGGNAANTLRISMIYTIESIT